MNTTNASLHGTNKETAKNPLDVRIILAVLWVAEVLSSLNGDTYRLNDPAVLKASLENNGSIVVSPELLSVMAILFVGHIFMSVLTLTLKSPVSLLGKPHHGHILWPDYSCFLGLGFCIAIRWL